MQIYIFLLRYSVVLVMNFHLTCNIFVFLLIVCNFATFFGIDTQNAEKNRLADFLVAPKGAKRF